MFKVGDRVRRIKDANPDNLDVLKHFNKGYEFTIKSISKYAVVGEDNFVHMKTSIDLVEEKQLGNKFIEIGELFIKLGEVLNSLND